MQQLPEYRHTLPGDPLTQPDKKGPVDASVYTAPEGRYEPAKRSSNNVGVVIGLTVMLAVGALIPVIVRAVKGDSTDSASEIANAPLNTGPPVAYHRPARASAREPAVIVQRLLAMADPGTLREHGVKVPTPDLARVSFADHGDAARGQIQTVLDLADTSFAARDYEQAAKLYEGALANGAMCYFRLACCYAQLGGIDQAFYWLQRSARDEGIDAREAAQQNELKPVWTDARGYVLLTDLILCNRYWQAKGGRQIEHASPAEVTERLPVIVALHDASGHPDDLHNLVRKHAQALNAHIVGISGTWAIGPLRYSWSEDADQDLQHVMTALDEWDESGSKIDRKHIVLLGVGQGARTAAQLLVRFPQRFRGAIVLGPGGFDDPELPEATAAIVQPNAPVAVIVTDPSGPSRRKTNARKYQNWFRRAGMTVRSESGPGMDGGVPTDFDAMIESWFAMMVSPRPD